MLTRSDNYAPSTVSSSLPAEKVAVNSEPATANNNGDHQSESAGPLGVLAEAIETRLLKNGDETQVLAALADRPLENVILRGTILDHGLESANNRGSFYGCFRDNSLIGVALIGHNILLQGCQEAIAAFANEVTRSCGSEARLLLGEEAQVETFCRLLLSPTSSLHVVRRTVEVLLAFSAVTVEAEGATPLRLAEPHEAEEVSIVNARGHLELNGFDPSSEDPEGFLERSRIRIEKGRVWIVRDVEGIAFKADVARVTDEAVYLEGVLTRPDRRGTGLGRAALSDLCQRLLSKHEAVCLLADAESKGALAFYQRLGFVPIARYQVVRFEKEDPKAKDERGSSGS